MKIQTRGATPTSTALRALAAAGLCASLLAGCGDSASGSDNKGPAEATSKRIDEIASLVPADIAEDGVLTMGTDPSDAPNEFLDKDGKTVLGVSADLGNEIAAILGLEPEFVPAPFSALLPAVQSGKYDLGVSAFTDTAEREEVVDMVSYSKAGTSWGVAEASEGGPDDACGLTLAVQEGSVQLEDAEKRAEECEAAGDDTINVLIYQASTDAATAVATGKADAWLSDYQIIAWAAEQSGGKIQLVGEPYDEHPLAIAVSKEQAGMAEAVQKAVQHLMDDGRYLEILEAWKVEDSAIEAAEINSES